MSSVDAEPPETVTVIANHLSSLRMHTTRGAPNGFASLLPRSHCNKSLGSLSAARIHPPQLPSPNIFFWAPIYLSTCRWPSFKPPLSPITLPVVDHLRQALLSRHKLHVRYICTLENTCRWYSAYLEATMFGGPPTPHQRSTSPNILHQGNVTLKQAPRNINLVNAPVIVVFIPLALCLRGSCLLTWRKLGMLGECPQT